jgi:hypothetical protein
MAIQHETAKTAGDALSLVTVVGTLAEVLPAIAALLTIVWTGFRIYETPTVTKWISLWRQRNNVKED